MKQSRFFRQRLPSRRARLGGRAMLLALLSLAVASATASEESLARRPLDVVFVLDNSGSMMANDPDFLTRRAVANFVEALAATPTLQGRVGIVVFDGRPRLAQPLAPAGEIASPRRLESVLASLDYTGQRSDSPSGVERALYELRERGRDEAHKAIIFLSDGRVDTGDPRNDVEVARWLREDLASESAEGAVRIFGVAFTDDADYQLMQSLARRTGARYYRAFAAAELNEVVADVLEKVVADPVDPFGPGEQDLAAASQSPLPPRPESAAPQPSAGAPPPAVAAAPRAGGETRDGLLGWLPIAALLVAAGYALRRRGAPRLDRQAAQPPAGPPAQLLDLGGQFVEAGSGLALVRGRTRIGRDPNNDLVLNDDTISSEHAVIELSDGRYWLEDLRSTNGTRLGEHRLEYGDRLPVKSGDRVRFADLDLMFVVDGYVPSGATAYLSSSTASPLRTTLELDSPATPEASQGPGVSSDEPLPRTNDEIVFAEQRERIDPATVVDLDAVLGEGPSEPVGLSEEPSESAIQRAEAAIAAVRRAKEEPPTAPQATENGDTASEQTPGENGDIAAEQTEAGDGDTPSEQTASPRSPSKRPALELITTPPPSTDFEETTVAEEAQPAPDADEEATEIFANEPTAPEPPSPIGLAPTAPPLGLCLDTHLARVAELSLDFRRFVERAFPEDLREALPMTALELIEAARASGSVETRAYTRERIRYVVCGVPGPMDAACHHFVAAFGGFTRLLTEHLEDEAFTRDRCETLALLTCGFDSQAWVSLSILPAEGQAPRLDLLSYEFLTEQEREQIAPSLDAEISQSGLA